MKGLEESERFFFQEGMPLIQDRFSDYVERMAAGLVGEGSECFGFDDSISRDHDWTPGFCVWLEAEDYAQVGFPMGRAYQELVDRKDKSIIETKERERSQRRGVFSTPVFYHRFLNRESTPRRMEDWMKIPEEYLAVCTNGKVFHDPLGRFSKFRNRLLRFYPEDVRLKKLAARCVSLAQDGQYNFPRSLKRGDPVAANHALARFIQAACSMVYLLGKRYKPFYKWMHRGLMELEPPGPEIAALMERLSEPGGNSREARNQDRMSAVEETGAILVRTLREMEISHSSSSFLLKHAAVIQNRIGDPEIRRLPLETG